MSSGFFAYSPPSGNLELVYADTSLLVVNKPAGLLAVPGRGPDKQDCLSARLQLEFSDVLIVHRLDMATSGLMIFARGLAMQRDLSRMFREREIDKRYVAVVAGKLDPVKIQNSRSLTFPLQGQLPNLSQGNSWDESWREVDLPIAADWLKRPLRKVDFDNGKPSLTLFRLLSFDAASNTSHIELNPITGRTHQLRVHMAAIGHPILGDTLYGQGASAPRLMLHASSISFAHPQHFQLMNFSCPGLS